MRKRTIKKGEVVPSFEDIHGVDVSVGDFILYTHIVGRSGCLKYGRVRQIKRTGTDHNGDGEFQVVVAGAERGWGRKKRVWDLNYAEGVLGRLELLLANDFIPEEVRNLLLGATEEE